MLSIQPPINFVPALVDDENWRCTSAKGSSMIATSPEHAVELLDKAFNQGDLESILGYYDDAAIVIPVPGVEARGHAEIRDLFQRFLRPGVTAHQIKSKVIEADGIALFTSRWALDIPGHPRQAFIATTVFRKQTDGGWKALIDNARGPEILELD
jgi:ketosteroid isomerase-like protein